MSQPALRLLILILIFASVMLGAERGASWFRLNRAGGRAINERLRLIARGFDRTAVLSRLRRNGTSGAIHLPGLLGGIGLRLDTVLRGTGFAIAPTQLLFMLLMVTALIFFVTIIASVLTGFAITFGTVLMIGCFAVAAGLGLPLMILARRADHRHKKMAEQFPVALDIFVRGLRAGHPVSSALDLLTQEMADPIGSEFGIVTDEVTYGADLRDALQNMADRCDLDDLRMFVVSLSVQNETGGNLAEILENLSRVIRERASMVLMVRALSSEGRMTATLLTALPILAFVALFLLNPPFYLDVAADPAFAIGFGCLLALYTVGFVIIRRLVDLKV
jgi:tight adherence protein B